MRYTNINGRNYWLPCTDCKDKYCASCAYTKMHELLQEEREQRQSAEFKIETELVPRIKQEQASYDCWATTDKSAEWDDAYEYQVDLLIDMFDEDFIYQMDFTNHNDIYDKIAQLILAEKENK